MTAKDKAIELHRKYWKIDTNNDYWTVSHLLAKKMAIIAVEEIINSGKDVDQFAYSYWYEVKKEIIKL